MSDIKKEYKKAYDITDFLRDKEQKEEKLKELEEELARIEIAIEEHKENYERFINNYLFKDSDIKVKIDFCERSKYE